MSGSIITSKGRARFAECAANNQPLNITHFVFADIPGNIDPGTPPESLTALPGAEVYRCPVLKRGKLSDDAVVYSVMIGASAGNFMLNAMGLLGQYRRTGRRLLFSPSNQNRRFGNGCRQRLKQKFYNPFSECFSRYRNYR